MSKINRVVYDFDRIKNGMNIDINNQSNNKIKNPNMYRGIYKITSIIYRNGPKAGQERHQEKDYQLYDDWRNMIVDLSIKTWFDESVYASMNCLYDKNNNKCSGHLTTSTIDEIIETYDNDVISELDILTLNSIYHLVKVEKDIYV